MPLFTFEYWAVDEQGANTGQKKLIIESSSITGAMQKGVSAAWTMHQVFSHNITKIHLAQQENTPDPGAEVIHTKGPFGKKL